MASKPDSKTTPSKNHQAKWGVHGQAHNTFDKTSMFTTNLRWRTGGVQPWAHMSHDLSPAFACTVDVDALWAVRANDTSRIRSEDRSSTAQAIATKPSMISLPKLRHQNFWLVWQGLGNVLASTGQLVRRWRIRWIGRTAAAIALLPLPPHILPSSPALPPC